MFTGAKGKVANAVQSSGVRVKRPLPHGTDWQTVRYFDVSTRTNRERNSSEEKKYGNRGERRQVVSDEGPYPQCLFSIEAHDATCSSSATVSMRPRRDSKTAAVCSKRTTIGKLLQL